MKLGDILISHGAIDQEKLEAALSDQRAFGGRLGRTLVDLGYLTEEKLVAALAEQLGLTTIDLDGVTPDADVLSCLPVDACERYGVFPVRVDRKKGVLWIATAEPERKQSARGRAACAQLDARADAGADERHRSRRARPLLRRARPARAQKLGEPISGIPTRCGSRLEAAAGRTRPRLPARAARAACGVRSAPRAARRHQLRRLPRPPMPQAAEAPLPLTLIAPAGPRADDPTAELARAAGAASKRAVSAQGRAFRSLVELLQEKGIVRRGEPSGARTSKKAGI